MRELFPKKTSLVNKKWDTPYFLVVRRLGGKFDLAGVSLFFLTKARSKHAKHIKRFSPRIPHTANHEFGSHPRKKITTSLFALDDERNLPQTK